MFHVPIWCPHVKLIPRVLLHGILYPAVARLPFMSPGLSRSGASFFVQRQVRKASDTRVTHKRLVMKRKDKFSRAGQTCGYKAVPGDLVNRSPFSSYVKMWLIPLVSHPTRLISYSSLLLLSQVTFMWKCSIKKSWDLNANNYIYSTVEKVWQRGFIWLVIPQDFVHRF